MNDGWTVVMAVCAAAGAWLARPCPRSVAVVLVVLALAVRRPVVLCGAVLLLAGSLAASAWAGVRPPPAGPFDATVTLLTDPADAGGALRVISRSGRRHVEVTARGRPASVLRGRLAGERIRVAGSLGPLAPSVRGRLARSHVAAEVVARQVDPVDRGNGLARATNGFRRLLVRGAGSMPPDRRALFTGFVLGDDRGQRPEVVEDFRESGLSHLLVVSGENVAFVLALAGPLLKRLRLGARWALGLAVLGAFGVLTRWEPSVLRAVAMAAVTMTAMVIGRPASPIRVLAIAVTAVLLIDPLLVGSVSFLLSVGACTGIVLLARPIADRLPGPRPIATASAVTLAAQAGVAPVLLPVFGPLPVVTLPANLLAIPAAGPLVVWGLLAGTIAGLSPPWLAALLHVPTRIMVWWIALVARTSAAAPVGRLTALPLLLVGLSVTVAVLVRHPPVRRLASTAALIVALVPTLLVARHPPLAEQEIARGASLATTADGLTLTIDRADPGHVIAALRSRRVTRLDLVVISGGGHVTERAVASIAARVDVARVVDGNREPHCASVC